MSELGNNATAPSPAVAPGGEHIDPAEVARDLAARWTGGVDPRIPAIIPAFDAPFFQAGLAGYSDAAMRIIARRHGCPFCVTEALLDRTLLAGGRGFTKADLGDLHDNIPGGAEDHPLACQIMGSDPAEMAAACLKVAEQGSRHDKAYRQLAYDHLTEEERAEVFDTHLRNPGGLQVGRLSISAGSGPSSQRERAGGIAGDALSAPDLEETCETLIDEINTLDPHPATSSPRQPSPASLSFETLDINLACPVKKIKSKARGGHWLAEPDGAIAILKAVRKVVPANIVCTVKLRRSFDDTPEMSANFDRILDSAFELGYSWATVHARTVAQKYIGPSRWDILRDIVHRNPDKLIFGSGDVWDAGEIFRMIRYTGVAAVAVARGCIGNPWIFRQARDMLVGRAPAPPSLAEQRAVLEEHFRLSVALNGEHHAGRLMRKFGIRFAAHHPSAEDVRRRFIAVGSLAQWRAVLDEHYPPTACASPVRSSLT